MNHALELESGKLTTIKSLVKISLSLVKGAPRSSFASDKMPRITLIPHYPQKIIACL